MATRTRNTSDEQYFTQAINRLEIDMDEHGTFARVISESICDKHGKRITYRVDIDESDPRNVHATNCQCPDRTCRKNYCKHMQVVDRFYCRIIHAENDKTFEQAIGAKLESFYQVRGKEIEAAGTLNRNRVPVAPVGTSSIEVGLAARGWMAR